MSTPAQRCAIAVELLEQALAPNGNGSEKVLKKGLKRHKIQLPDNEARKQLAQRMLGRYFNKIPRSTMCVHFAHFHDHLVDVLATLG